MRYNLDNKPDIEAAVTFLTGLVAKHALVDIKKVSPKRTLNQNNYLYLILGVFGNHFGYFPEEAKSVFKEVNSQIFKYAKNGRTFYRSTADLTKEEMIAAIDKFMQKSAEQGCPLPPATDQEWLMSVQNEMEQQGYYLK